MKKLLTIISLLITIPVFAACSIENETTSCSIAEFKEINPTYSPSINLKKYS